MANIQFSHANGFPATTYKTFLELLSPHKVSYVEKFGHKDFKVKNNWDQIVDELIQDIELKQIAPVVALGHSFGGIISLFAANKRPELFESIIIMDSPIFTLPLRLAIRISQLVGYDLPIARYSKRRRTSFDSFEHASMHLKNKKLFLPFDKRCFDDYINYGFVPKENRVDLAFDANVEYKIFQNMPAFFPKMKLEIPSFFITASQGDPAIISNQKWIQHNFKGMKMLTFDGGHLFPMEKPEETAIFIKNLISS